MASALVGLLAVFAIGRLLWDAPAGLAAALILATSPFYFLMAHQVLTDMMLTAWMSWALYFYLAACRAPNPLWSLFGFYLCVAGGLARKGPAALMAWDFHLRSPVSEVKSEADATELLASPPKARLLIRAVDWQRLKPQAAAGWKVLDEGQVGRRRFVLLGS